MIVGIEPKSFGEVVKDERWRDAMKKEIQALEDNGTWIVKLLPPDKKTIRCKWVVQIKYNAYGMIERYKARVVILRNRQVEGIDYNETFAPMAKMVTARTLLTVPTTKN